MDARVHKTRREGVQWGNTQRGGAYRGKGIPRGQRKRMEGKRGGDRGFKGAADNTRPRRVAAAAAAAANAAALPTLPQSPPH